MFKKNQKKSKVKKVDMGIVKWLLMCRDKRNDQLAATKYFCTLRPKKNEEPCASCVYFNKCRHYRWEREYIHKEEQAYKTSKTRKKKKGDKYQEIIELNYLTEEYPCYPFEFDCPDRETCEVGQFCPW